MNYYIPLLLLPFLITVPAFAEINTDKSVYYVGDKIVISGTVTPEDGITSLQLLVTGKDITGAVSMADISQHNISGDSWNHSIITGGNVWVPDTIYTVKATYNQISQQTTFFYTEQPSNNNSNDSSSSSNNNSNDSSSSSNNNTSSSNNNSNDSSSSSNNQNIFSFVDPEKDPQHYIDRYNNEQNYRDWFDSNYSGYTIYDAVGMSDPTIQSDIPSWIKNVFKFYSEGNIGDDELKQALVWLIQEDILKIE